MSKSKRNLHYPLALLALLLLVLAWSAIKPADYFTWVLEVSPAVAGILCFVFFYKRLTFTSLSYTIAAVLFILMFIGGHYTYDDVPWFEHIQKAFHAKRNDYDRFGHFLKGFSVIIVRETLVRKTPLNLNAWTTGISLSIVLAVAAAYEIIEWLVSKIVGRSAKDFLGTQGDLWDSQWDMSLAFCGAVIALILLSHLHNKLIDRP